MLIASWISQNYCKLKTLESANAWNTSTLCMWHWSLIKVFQAALISSGLVSIGKCSCILSVVVICVGLDCWNNDIYQLISNFPIYLMFLLPYLRLLEAKKKMQVPCQHFHYVNAVEKTMKVCVTLRSKCVDKCTYALITILSISKGNVHTQVHNSTVVFFNCEREEYSLCYIFPHVRSLPALSIDLFSQETFCRAAAGEAQV